MELRLNQLESWNRCVKNANIVYKAAEASYRTERLKGELINEGLIKSSNQKKSCKDYLQAKNKLQLAINHLKWAQDGLDDFMDTYR